MSKICETVAVVAAIPTILHNLISPDKQSFVAWVLILESTVHTVSSIQQRCWCAVVVVRAVALEENSGCAPTAAGLVKLADDDAPENISKRKKMGG